MKQLNADLFTNEKAIIVYLFVAKILLHLLHPEYGYFRDELYYVTVGDGFGWGNLDVLPLTPLYIKMMTAIFGYSIKSIHFASAITGAFSIVFICLITRELGGKKYAMLISGLLLLFSGYLIFGAMFTYDSLDFLLQVIAIYLLVRLFKEQSLRNWLFLGLVLGLGLLNKLTILAFGLAIFVVLWLVPQRNFYKKPGIWLAGSIALIFLAPFIIWQISQDWYFLDFAASYSGGIAYVASFPEYLWSQVLPNNIASLPFWIAGLGFLLFSSRWKKYRFFGFMYLFLFFLYFILGVKFYFLIPMYTVLYAAGSVELERFCDNRCDNIPRRKWARLNIPVIYVLLSIPLLPMIVPILPIDQFIDYAANMSVHAGVRHENLSIQNLPQHVADRFGWPEMTEMVGTAYDSVSATTDEEIGIITENYGQAAAIHVLGKKYDLPEPVSLHGWFYFEALDHHQVKNNYICLGIESPDLVKVFRNVRKIGVFTHPYCIPHENNNPLYFVSGPKYDLHQYWRVSRRIDPRFRELLETQSLKAAIDYYHQTIAEDSMAILFTESQINALGYEFLNNGRLNDAIALFKFNIKEFPASANVYDSLGEAYLVNGERENAILYYEKALEVDPQFENARRMLEEIKSSY